ncbi:MAG: glycosyl hydrolase family 28-related protein [Planctomycetota bacterium]
MPAIALPAYALPVGAPQLPANVDVFAPSFATTAPSSAAPVISEWTRTAGPGESVVLTGDQFTRWTDSAAGADTQIWVYAQTTSGNGTYVAANIQHLAGDSELIVTIPPSVPSGSMFLIWVQNNDGVSAPVAINQTETWWIGPNATAAGETIGVYGQNLSRTGSSWKVGDAGSAPASVWVESVTTGVGQWATVVAVDPYRVDFVVPTGLANGNYRAWVHNGHGGAYGWGQPQEFTVRSAQDNGTGWTGPTFQVTSFGAIANDGIDDTLAVQAALSAAAAVPYSTVQLPAGTLLISQRLTVPANVRLKGAGMDATTLKGVASESFSKYLIYNDGSRATNNIEIRDLTIDSGATLSADGTAYVGGITSLIYCKDQSDNRFTNVRLYSPAGEAFTFGNATVLSASRWFLNNCQVISRGNTIILGNQVFLSGTTFWGTNDAPYAIYNSGGQGLSVSYCTASSLNDSDPSKGAGWGQRFFTNTSSISGTREQYFAFNGISKLGVRPTSDPNYSNNVGEALLWEGNLSQYIGYATSATAGTITLGDFSSVPSSSYGSFNDGFHYASIVSGTGVGQMRRIASFDAATFTFALDSAWNVIPDVTSKISIMNPSERIVVFKNSITGIQENVDRVNRNGSAGIMMFGGSNNVIVDGNTITSTRLAVSIWSMSRNEAFGVANQPIQLLQPSNFNLIVRNTINNSRRALGLFTAVADSTSANAPTAQAENRTLIGNVLRANSVTTAIDVGFEVAHFSTFQEWSSNQTVASNVFESNVLKNAPIGIDLDVARTFNYSTSSSMPRIDGLLLLNNTVTRGTATLTGSKGVETGSGQNVLMIGNSVTNFATQFAGVKTANLVEAPLRVLDVTIAYGQSRSLNFTFYNVSQTALSWTLSSNVPWLSFSSGGSGTTQPQALATVNATVDGSYFSAPTETSGLVSIVRNGVVLMQLQVVVHVVPPPATAIVAGPSTLARQFSFTFAAVDVAYGGTSFTYDIDWNGDGVYDQSTQGANFLIVTRMFAAGGTTTLRFRATSVSGMSSVSELVFDPNVRRSYFVGSYGDDAVSFVSLANDILRVDLSRVAGVTLNSSRYFAGVVGPLSADGGMGNDLISAQSVTNLAASLTGGGGNDTLIGGNLNDTLSAGAGNDSLDGGAGDDILDGGADNDTYAFSGSSQGTDQLIDEAGELDYISFAKFATGVTFNLGNATQTVAAGTTIVLPSSTRIEGIIGSNYADLLTGNGSANILRGLGGNDTLNGLGGDDVYDYAENDSGNDVIAEPVGYGNDRLNFANYNQGVTVNLSAGTASSSGLNVSFADATAIESVTGSPFNDRLTASSLATVLQGMGGDDTLTGGNGNDTLEGGAGSDILDGRRGDDSLVGGSGGDLYKFSRYGSENLGTDRLSEEASNASNEFDILDFSSFNAGVTARLDSNLPQLVHGSLTVQLNEPLHFEAAFGSAYNDVLTGNSITNIIHGGAGNDLMAGGDGDDLLLGGEGNDTLRGETGSDMLFGEAGDDTLEGGSGNDMYSFVHANSSQPADLGTDTIVEGTGTQNDLYDILYFGGFSESISVNLGTTGLQNISPNLRLSLSSTDALEIVVGTNGNDLIYGNGRTNLLMGLGGNDLLYGLGQRDILVGGQGADVLDGGTAQDILVAGDFDLVSDTLDSIFGVLNEWRSSRNYYTRIFNLTGVGMEPLLNGNSYLQVSSTLFDDDEVDTLIGGIDDLDWFFSDFGEDIVLDLQAGELDTDL